MFLLVSKFKMIGMLLNVVHGQVQKKTKKKKHITKESNGFPNYSTLINYEFVHHSDLKFVVCRQKSKMS